MISHRKILFLTFFVFLLNQYLTAQVTFIVESLPETTLPNDTIFLSGTFNEWAVNDKDYVLKKQVNGRFAITLSLDKGVYEYKFTRGSWMKAETSENNEYIPNRVVEIKGDNEVHINIINWQDHGGVRKTSYTVYYYFAIAFQALLLMLLVLRIKRKDANRALCFYGVNVFLALLFLGIVCYNSFGPIWQTYLIFVSQVLIFIWGPLSYLFIRSFFKGHKKNLFWLHFLPASLAVILVLIKFFNISVIERWLPGDLTLIGLGAVSTLIYIGIFIGYVKFKTILLIKKDFTYNFISIFILINLMVQLAVFSSMYLRFIDFIAPLILLSFLVILQTYYIWKQPKLLKEQIESNEVDDEKNLLKELQDLMEKEKIYRNAELNIHDLSKILHTKSHILSKVLNSHHHKNFRDFVNNYRVKEFIYLAQSGELEKYTFLGLAHEVGFNSKSTFNLAFKKITKQNPRDFLKST